MHASDQADLTRHITQLAASQKGRSAIRHILDWLDDDGLALDQTNQNAIISLIALAWRYPGSTRDAMRNALTPRF